MLEQSCYNNVQCVTTIVTTIVTPIATTIVRTPMCRHSSPAAHLTPCPHLPPNRRPEQPSLSHHSFHHHLVKVFIQKFPQLKFQTFKLTCPLIRLGLTAAQNNHPRRHCLIIVFIINRIIVFFINRIIISSSFSSLISSSSHHRFHH